MPKKKGNGLYYFCHRCNAALPFSKLLENLDAEMYKEYKKERIAARYGGSKATKSDDIAIPKFNTAKRLQKYHSRDKIVGKLKNMAEMPAEVSRYLIGRKIPLSILWKYFYYTSDFNSFANGVCPGTFSKKACYYKEPRIVIIMPDIEGKITAIQGRELKESYAKYVTIKTDEQAHKIFGMDRIDNSKPVYVLEGPIDSTFIENAIGVCGADLVSQVCDLDIEPVFVFDNEPRSKIITNKILSAIKGGHKVVIPHNKEKDINMMVLQGIDVQKMVAERTFIGLRAIAEFNKWKRV